MRLATVGKYLPLLVLLAPVAAQAKPNWKAVYTGSDLKVALDTQSVTANPDGSYTVWTTWDYAKTRVVENKMFYTRLVEKAVLKCSPVVMKRVNTTLYDRAGTVVKPAEELSPTEVMNMTWDSPKRGSDGAKAWAAVCKTVKARKKA